MIKKISLIGLLLTVLLIQFWGIFSSLWEPEVRLSVVSFEALPHWTTANLSISWEAFQRSCRVFLKQDPDHVISKGLISLQVRDWQPICREALRLKQPSQERMRHFFETRLQPLEFVRRKPVVGIFTAYYLPLVEGRLSPSQAFSVPLYGPPSSQTVVTRLDINKGALVGRAPVIAWVRSQMDRLMLEIEGSGGVQLSTKKRLLVGYAGENGAPYTSIPSLMIKKGLMRAEEASILHIRQYFIDHPEQADAVINQNKSFVFFRDLKQSQVVGAQGVPLTPGYSLAVDRRWIPLGVPLWLETTLPEGPLHALHPLYRLMMAQDTGGAIIGPVRGDIFAGSGEEAMMLSNYMQYPGRYWLLLPRPAEHAWSLLNQFD